MANRLALEGSTYLLQHKDNPVDWFPWGEEAFRQARERDKPILLSIGYSACHWCHVMAHESFEDQRTADFMNAEFVNVKVDREERPDVDALYMRMVQTTTGQGGWPLTVFLMPDGKPFYGGMYFPPEDRHGLPGFARVLSAIAEAYAKRRDDVERAAEDVRDSLESQMSQGKAEAELSEAALESGVGAMLAALDSVEGGFGTGMKFPQPAVLDYLLFSWRRTGDNDALNAVALTLRKMALGGIYDQLGGGFSRYAVDRRWRVPHFEKMLYDNAQLAKLYVETWQITGVPLFKATAEETLGFCLKELRDAGGGFFAALDADSEGIEGKFYAWKKDEFEQAAGEDAALARSYWGVTDEGDYEQGNVLRRAGDEDKLAAEFGLSAEELQARLNAVRLKLLEYRSGRVYPARDEKVVLSWNALMADALAYCGAVFRNDEWLQAAVECVEFMLANMVDQGSGRLLRIWTQKNGPKTAAFLEDYAMLANALLTLYQSCLDGRYLEIAQSLAMVMVQLFWNREEGAFYDVGKEHEQLVVRPRDVFDGALPSGGATAAAALQKMAEYTGNSEHKEVARRAVDSVGDWIRRAPMSVPHWLKALGLNFRGFQQLVLAGERSHPNWDAMLEVARSQYAPDVVLAAADGDSDADFTATLPILKDRTPARGAVLAYLCRNYVCDAPVGDAAQLEKLLSGG